MSKKPAQRSPEFKLKIAVEALKSEQSISQLASEYGLHPKQIQRWRDQLLREAAGVFVHKTTKKKADPDKTDLLKIIKQHEIELDFLKKKLEQLP
jgi:transposase